MISKSSCHDDKFTCFFRWMCAFSSYYWISRLLPSLTSCVMICSKSGYTTRVSKYTPRKLSGVCVCDCSTLKVYFICMKKHWKGLRWSLLLLLICVKCWWRDCFRYTHSSCPTLLSNCRLLPWLMSLMTFFNDWVALILPSRIVCAAHFTHITLLVGLRQAETTPPHHRLLLLYRGKQ